MDIVNKTTGDSLTAAEYNESIDEIQNAIEAENIALSGADLNQLGKVLSNKATTGNFFTDSGSTNAYVLSSLPSNENPTLYRTGMLVRFIASNDNTASASTVNVTGLGVRNIIHPPTFPGLQVGEISGYTELRYNGSEFELLNGFDAQVGPSWGAFAEEIGTALAITNTGEYLLQSALTPSSIVIADGLATTLRSYFYDGTAWQAVSNALILSNDSYVMSCCRDNLTVLLYNGSTSEIEAYRLAFADWIKVTNTLTAVGTTSATGMVCLDSDANMYAYLAGPGNNQVLQAFSFDGTDFANVGNALSFSDSQGFRLVALTSNIVVTLSFNSNVIAVYSFNGNDWILIGTPLFVVNFNIHVMAALNQTDIIAYENSLDNARIFRFDGDRFNEISGVSINLLVNNQITMSFEPLSGNMFLLYDTSSDGLKLFKWDQASGVPKNMKNVGF